MQAFNHNVRDDPLVDTITSLVKCRLLSDLKWKVWCFLRRDRSMLIISLEGMDRDTREYILVRYGCIEFICGRLSSLRFT